MVRFCMIILGVFLFFGSSILGACSNDKFFGAEKKFIDSKKSDRSNKSTDGGSASNTAQENQEKSGVAVDDESSFDVEYADEPAAISGMNLFYCMADEEVSKGKNTTTLGCGFGTSDGKKMDEKIDQWNVKFIDPKKGSMTDVQFVDAPTESPYHILFNIDNNDAKKDFQLKLEANYQSKTLYGVVANPVNNGQRSIAVAQEKKAAIVLNAYIIYYNQLAYGTCGAACASIGYSCVSVGTDGNGSNGKISSLSGLCMSFGCVVGYSGVILQTGAKCDATSNQSGAATNCLCQ